MPTAATVLAIAAISLPSLHIPFIHKGKSDQPPRVEHLKPAKGWRLTVRTDRFTGEKLCRLEARDTLYQDGVVTFRFAHWVDSANAEFRVGQGPVRSVGEVAVAAAGLGARFLSDNTRNPSDGAVRIPASQLTADSVTIRPNRHKKPHRFSLVGFQRSLAVARERGCA
jgi:hypothetical protein